MNRSHKQSQSVVLISGCSSGIGLATARRLCHAGHLVYATARLEKSVDELAALPEAHDGRLHARRLDVTDESTIAHVVDEIQDAHGAVDVLINNAGYGQLGAVEELDVALWRRQMEVNVLGAVALTRACLPTMRSRGSGRIINVSSVVAHVALPMMGAYCASKHALDAFSVALRVEVAGFGIKVVLIEPGPTATAFRENLERGAEDGNIGTHPAYRSAHESVRDYWQSRFGKQGATADDVARQICKAVAAKNPKRRYRITAVAHWLPRLLAFAPEAWFDRVARKRMGEPCRQFTSQESNPNRSRD